MCISHRKQQCVNYSNYDTSNNDDGFFGKGFSVYIFSRSMGASW